MRVTPVGLLPCIEEVLRLAEVQARVTHDSAGGVESAQAAALTVHYCYHRLGPTPVRQPHFVTRSAVPLQDRRWLAVQGQRRESARWGRWYLP